MATQFGRVARIAKMNNLASACREPDAIGQISCVWLCRIGQDAGAQISGFCHIREKLPAHSIWHLLETIGLHDPGWQFIDQGGNRRAATRRLSANGNERQNGITRRQGCQAPCPKAKRAAKQETAITRREISGLDARKSLSTNTSLPRGMLRWSRKADILRRRNNHQNQRQAREGPTFHRQAVNPYCDFAFC